MGRNRIVLVLMVKNESKIIERCLKSVEGLVDAFCITDTGSTDTTCEIVKEFLKTHTGCLSTCEWRDFGHNRTLSAQFARTYVKDELKWDLQETYGLLLDGDMVFQPGTLKQQALGELGYTIVQKAGNLAYPNCRLIRLDSPWVCKGVTHEYWDGSAKPLSQEICWIDDRNDGGCKSDKFERDARLLEQGLKDEPDNVRYKFYLAQTYHSLGRYKDAIAMYKKRIAAGGWYEEVWYSHYMIGQSYLSLGDPIRFEGWMLRTYAKNPRRAEPLYKLTKYFRENSQHIKAYHYAKIGAAIPLSTDSLFVETDVYTRLFAYEQTILLFYLNLKRDGLEASMKYMLTQTDLCDSVYRNLSFYIEPLGALFTNHPVPRDALGLDFHPTSTCIFDFQGKTYHNVRFVNYAINQNTGGYSMKEGGYSDNHKVRTRNCLWDGETALPMDESDNTLPRRDAHILGLEDVRVYRSNGGLKFVAVSNEHSERIRIVQGAYDALKHRLSDCTVLESPTNADCEKNWIPLHDDPRLIYRWHPFETYTVEGTALKLKDRYETPWFFQHVRGSAVPVKVGDELWALAHCVEYSTPRKYSHFFVSLDPKSLRPLAITLPFVFRAPGIEYCIGVRSVDDRLECIFSSWDDNPRITNLYPEDLEWIQL
jgi:glycosyltransferase involved in cell wall biosynthesis